MKIIELGKSKKARPKNRCLSKRYILNRKIQTGCNNEKYIPVLSKCTKYISISDKVNFRIKSITQDKNIHFTNNKTVDSTRAHSSSKCACTQ